ncbi:RIIA lysis inhibitor [Vibrio phage K567]
MIIHTPDSTVQTSGKMRTAGFNMKASAKGFRIISTTLYKDPILAIVRELTCNGWDAHQMNGNKDTAIEVHLPNQFEPWFSVKDFGCGMSDDDIFGVYTTVFDSTKDDSNDVIGAMGLGSKTPFSYNNGQSFTVKSVKDGLKAVYSAYLDRGEPAITCMNEPAPTDEPDGVEVIVPVRKEDFSRFKESANSVMPYFKSPVVNTNISLDKREFVHMDGYYTETKTYHYRSTNVYAVMGNVCYPLNSGYIEGINDVRSYFKSSDLYIEFAIGELDVSASREELHYDDRTIENINTRVNEINEGFLKQSQDWVDEQNFKHISEAWRACDNRFSDVIMGKMMFGDVRVNTYRDQIQREFLIDDKRGLGGKTVMFRPESMNKEGVARRTDYNRASDILDVRRDFEAKPIMVVHDDLKTGGVSIVKEYVRQTRNAVFYHHDEKYSTTGTILLLKARLRDSEYVVLKTSDLKADYTPEKKPKSKNAKPVARTVQLYRVTIDEDDVRSIDVHELDKKVLREDGVHFVSLYRDYIERNIGDEHGMEYNRGVGLVETIMRLKGLKEVYIVRRGEIEHIKSNKNAINLFDLKFNKREVRSKIDWKTYTITDNLHGWRCALKSAWYNDAVRECFGYERTEHTCNTTIDRLCSEFPVIKQVREAEKEKHLAKLMKIQENPRYQLAWNLIDNCTSNSDAQQLMTLLRGKRNGKLTNRN